jgi:hypothetical protein
VEWSRKGLELAPVELRQDIAGHVELFRSARPCRVEPPQPHTGIRPKTKATPWWKKKKNR